MDHKESSKRSSKRPSSSRPDAGREREPDRPPAKKQALPQQPSSAEDIRSAVRGLYQAYQALVDAEGPSEAAFQALLKATAAGDLASRRLAARLVPRFLAHHPEHSEPAAAALIRLHCQQQAADPSCKSLEDLSRQDALAGLGAVLKAARACRAPHGEAAVKLVLDHLFRLLPAAASEEPSEPEEEGEVAPSDGSSASLGFLKRTLGEALSLHPAATMAYCSACLAAAAACRGNSSSSSSRDCPDPQAVLLGSEELQGWVMRQARSRATAPPEVRSVIESALQLLPEDKQLEALRPRPDTYHATPGAAAAGAANCSRGTPQQQQQQQRLKSSGSLPHYSRQQQNGGLVNGAEPLSRSLSTPGQLERDRSRAGGSKLGAPEPRTQQQQQQQQFPQPPGPICRAEPCLLVLGLPPHISRQELQQTLGAEEAWLAPQQQQQQAGGRGLGSSSSSACCTFKGVLEAAKAYLRHNGMQRLPHCPPLRLAFCDCLPPGNAKAAAAAAAAGSAQAPGYVWATRDAVGDAESITDELRAAGLSLNHAHRVNNAAEPGTLLQTPSAAHAASVVSYLLKKHPQQQQQQQQQGEQEMPPLPPEPPPAADWARQQQQQQQQAVPPLPPGPPPVNYQQQQQQLDRAATGGAGRPASPGLLLQQQQQQQQQGYVDPGGTANVRRSYSSPSMSAGAAAAAAAAGNNGSWRDSPSEWSTTPSHPTSSSSSSMLTSAPEPRGWPDALHVNFRICVGDALEQYAASAPDARAVRLLLPLSPDGGDATALQSFINYLNGKDRAGMVKLPPLREHGLGPRAVYLIPPKPGVCQQLQVGWDGRAAMLIAVVVPQPSAAGGGPGGSGGGSAHRGYR
ncbi:hypothetical protein OEZ85_000455 [Tetradesmus obliquus]|uniref:Spen paralogue and orthologue SPOC C-terminal domain-containing protein n=1 Tax=Tetradesmus obliquus TaxID=3088 RepID=A0ABY8UIU2_TETOB|nr:hypothetical protein OEZ85_000455 [Tetradesmus obliquus]